MFFGPSQLFLPISGNFPSLIVRVVSGSAFSCFLMCIMSVNTKTLPKKMMTTMMKKKMMKY